MTGFSGAWLDLREAADRRARDGALLTAAAGLIDPARPVVDLGCGTGATRRAFREAGREAPWLFVDDDPTLLTEARARCGNAEFLRLDLADMVALPLAGAGLVTASALLDLVSAAWAEALCAALAADSLPLYAALTYDGRTEWEPAHPLDGAVLDAFNRHQRGDKGLGPALGPAAPGHFDAALSRLGYSVRTAASPWRLGPAEAALQAELARGMAQAAAEAGLDAAKAAEWLKERIRLAPRGTCEVGHQDLLAAPPLPGGKLQSNNMSVPR